MVFLKDHRTPTMLLVGVEWKGFSAFVQFYGVNNINRYAATGEFFRTVSLRQCL